MRNIIKILKKIIWNIHDELAYSHWFWLDGYYGKVSDEQIDFFMNNPYYKALVQKVVNASALLEWYGKKSQNSSY